MERSDTGDTKGRLMAAAGRVFSEKGFKAATVRDICRLAGANVAAVHYHFGDKAGLYRALLDEAFELGLKRYPPNMGLPENAPAEERLFAFVHSFLLRMLGDGSDAWCGKLMALELNEPTPALDHLVERYITPMSRQLRRIAADLLADGTKPEDDRAFLCAMSIAGQCQHIFRNRAVIDKLSPGFKTEAEDVMALARHITEFSLCALRGISRARKEEQPG